ncbi:MAG: iron dicitrate transport regulator FecR [Phenylobacterium zucineum]|nr:MAG: iron dicitrate transport regulator FecR [Phenylobacterium zucineum]
MVSIVADEERTMAQASAWLARLQRDDVSEADGGAFDAWLDEAPAHRAAYEQVLAAWQTFDLAADDILAEIEAGERRSAQRRPVSRRWMVGAGGFAAAAALAVAILPALTPAAITTYATGKGEREQFTLADGSTIDLNAETRLTVSYDRGARKVVLEDGEAIFDVTHDAKRPFTVAASKQVVRVLGTQFDVRSRQGDLSVTVARGKVQVEPAKAVATDRAFVLRPGQRLEIPREGAAQLRTVDPQEAFGWRAGRLVYRGQTLAEVVADLNRQYVAQIEIADPSLARMPITGVIVLDDQDAVMQRLSLMLPVRSVPSDRGLLLLRK